MRASLLLVPTARTLAEGVVNHEVRQVARRLFVPVAQEPYEWFLSGRKHWELRRQRGVFSSRNVAVGRRVEVRLGYGLSARTPPIWGTVTAVTTDTTIDSIFERIPFAELIPSATDSITGALRAANILGIEPSQEGSFIAFRIDFDNPHGVLPEVALARKYRALVLRGEKTTTVRRGHRDLVLGPALLRFGPDDFLHIAITSVTYTFANALSDADARRDGFSSRGELLAALKRHYRSFKEDDPVTIVELKNGVDCRPRASRD
jgi:hypothetical protein